MPRLTQPGIGRGGILESLGSYFRCHVLGRLTATGAMTGSNPGRNATVACTTEMPGLTETLPAR